ncbi:MAG: hypothetical protein R3C68_16920, partial [Myxococcota bacterium]
NDSLCGGSKCNNCSCLPAGTFWEFSEDPKFVSVDSNDSTYYCLGEEKLIDATTVLDVTYDLNGNAPGAFSGEAPDVGGREAGSGGCP